MLAEARIFHVNVNCSDLDRSRAFYIDGCGLVEGARTSPEQPQPGEAFGFDRAWWDAVILIGANGFDGGAIDLLQWLEPEPTGAPPAGLGRPGFQRVGVEVVDLDAAMARCAGPTAPGTDRLVRDPDGTCVELVAGTSNRVAFVAVACADLDRSVAFYLALGFREADRSSSPISPPSASEVVLDAPGGGEVQLRLVGLEPSSAVAPEARPANALGMWRTALLLPGLDAAVDRLMAADVELLSEPQAMSMGPGLPELHFVCFRGPDLEVIELIEVPAPDA